MKDLFCNKRQIKLDTEFEICNNCFKKKKSGYENQNMCKEFESQIFSIVTIEAHVVENRFLIGKYLYIPQEKSELRLLNITFESMFTTHPMNL